eukprot:7184469-Alexandrium_andersonii.AAC.1
MLVIVLVESGESVRASKGVRGQVPQHRTTRTEGSGALDPLEEGALDANVLDKVFPGTDAVASVCFEKVSQVPPCLLPRSCLLYTSDAADDM